MTEWNLDLYRRMQQHADLDTLHDVLVRVPNILDTHFGYVLSATKNQLKDTLRKASWIELGSKEVNFEKLLEADRPRYDEHLINQEIWPIVLRALKELSELDQVIIHQRFFEESSFEEILQKLNESELDSSLTLSLIRRRCSRAVAYLKKVVDNFLEGKEAKPPKKIGRKKRG